ncbi:MAG: glycosyltransferase [Desulfobulbaceae bacterium]|nr:glycosyltransferase [Desulfobulbaceae bacterium]
MSWALSLSDKPKVVIAYSLTSVFLSLLCYIKKYCPQVITIIVVPDLPQYMNTSNNIGIVYKMLKSSSIKHIRHKIGGIDGFVLLTSQMSANLNISKKKIVIIEGVSGDIMHGVVSPELRRNGVISIVYTGTLHERYGVLNLVKAFEQIKNDNYRLVLCGAGDSEKKISDAACRDSRIIFKGQLDKTGVLNEQVRATVLVNPRQNNEEFTKYSFPSKNMEYLSSGRPLIAYKLDGIPDEYDSYINYVLDNSVEALANKIMEVCSNTNEYLAFIGANAKDWVIREKNPVIQAKKIISMISELQ